MKIYRGNKREGSKIEVTTLSDTNLNSETRYNSKKVIPWMDSIFVIISLLMLLIIIIPSLLETKSSDREDVFTIAQTLADLTNKDRPENYIYTKDSLLNSAALIKAGNGVKVSLKLSINDGILVSLNNRYACVKLSSTGAVAYSIDAKSLC
jgi:hypothetical protein